VAPARKGEGVSVVGLVAGEVAERAVEAGRGAAAVGQRLRHDRDGRVAVAERGERDGGLLLGARRAERGHRLAQRAEGRERAAVLELRLAS
jgi:hypothetical protein